jgi:hypothetical protein
LVIPQLSPLLAPDLSPLLAPQLSIFSLGFYQIKGLFLKSLTLG